MSKISNNDPCPCNSGKKYKKCCRDKIPRQHDVIVGSAVPLKGVYYDRDAMTFQGIDHNDNLVKPITTFSQTYYIGQAGKEKVLTRTHDKVIPNEADLLKHLSSFDMIIAVDTNTRKIGGHSVSVSGIVHCIVKASVNGDGYLAEFPHHGICLFRSCPEKISPEKFGWINIIKEISRNAEDDARKICIVTDHDLDNHNKYNSRQLSIIDDVYLPINFTMMYGKGDSSKENLLNYLIQLCDKRSTQTLKEIEHNGCLKYGDKNILITQIPVPAI